MALEIERKYLVKNDSFKAHAHQHTRLRQGYLSTQKDATVRLRLIHGQGILTIKGPSKGATRSEFEYNIPPQDAEEMLDTLCSGGLIEKIRFEVTHKDHLWVVDVFEGANLGLIVAEIELLSEDEPFAIPHWLGDEVTDDPRYFNSKLLTHPYTAWDHNP